MWVLVLVGIPTKLTPILPLLGDVVYGFPLGNTIMENMPPLINITIEGFFEWR